ncbi:M24B family metallopeptidase [Pelagibacteraceae bacterium]|nr:M24B family metallopeptidase [Pelagibacteraceae bacterium]
MLSNNNKLSKIRSLLKKNEIDYYILPHSDEFQNEFLPEYSKRLEWISNFSGSAGDIIIGNKEAFLFVDGRYTIQASQEVNRKNFKIYNYSDLSPIDLLKYKNPKSIGIDGNTLTYQRVVHIKKSMKKGVKIKTVEKNLIDQIWSNRPKKKKSKPFAISGANASAKVNFIKKYLHSSKADYYLITACDSIAWTFNIRAKDIKYSPLFLSKALIHKSGKCYIFSDFTNSKNIKFDIDIEFINTSELDKQINNLSKKETIICDLNSVSFSLVNKIKSKAKLKLEGDLIQLLKSKKNKSERSGMVECHKRDGATLTKFIFWIKNKVRNKKITELDAIKYLDKKREKNEKFFSLSFPTIAGTGSNGAIVHYRANKRTNKLIKTSDLFLVDSGAQYMDGTTDVTRTICFNTPSKEQIEMYTRVLKGHIAVASSKIKYGETGKKLDFLARQPLQEVNCNFDHGTGHGVGCFLNVHESPPSISKNSKIKFEDGMIVSNEPGYYKKIIMV